MSNSYLTILSKRFETLIEELKECKDPKIIAAMDNQIVREHPDAFSIKTE
jgi:hypothetical protein